MDHMVDHMVGATSMDMDLEAMVDHMIGATSMDMNLETITIAISPLESYRSSVWVWKAKLQKHLRKRY